MKADVNVGALVASLGMDTKEFEKALKNAKRSVDEAEENMSSKMKDIGKSMDKAGQSMQKFGRNLTQYVTLPLGTASGAALKLEKDFEKHMTKIVSLVGVAGDQVSAWRDDVLDLSSEVGRAPKELARGLYFITSAGLRGQEAMDVLTASAKASAAGLGDVKLVADNVTSALNAYKDTNLEASEATDILINAVRLGKVEAEDMAVAMGHVFPVASKLGVSFDQVAAAVASLTRTGTPAETAAVQIRQALGQLIGPAREAHGALNDLNWSSQEFREAIAEEGLFPAMETFVDKVEDFGNIEVAKKVFGNIRALTGIFDLMGGNIEHNRMIFEEMQDSLGRTNKAFEIVSATLDHKWNVALSNAKVAAIAVGEELKKVVIPILNDLADWLRNAVDWWGDLTDAEKQAILNWGKVVAAIGPVISIFGKLTALIGGVVKGTGKLISIFSKVASASIAVSGPIAAIIALLGSLAAATVYVVDNKEKFISTEKRAANMLKEVHKEYGKQIAQSTTLFQELESLAAKEELDNVQKEKKQQLLMELNGKYRDYLPFVLDENSSLQQIKEAQEAVNSELKRNILLKVKKEQAEKLENDLIKTKTDAYVELAEKMKEWGFSASQFQQVVTKALKGDVNEAVELAQTFAKKTEGVTINSWNNIDQKIGAVAYNVKREMEDTNEILGYLTEGYDKLGSEIGGIDSYVLEEVDEESASISESLSNLRKIVGGVGDEFDNMKEPLKDTFSKLQEEFSELESKMLDMLAAGESVPDKMVDKYYNLKNEIKSIEDEFSDLIAINKEMPKQLDPIEIEDIKMPEPDEGLFDPDTALGNLNAVSAAAGKLGKEFKIADEQAKVFGLDVDALESKMDSTAAQMDYWTKEGFSAQSDVIQTLENRYKKLRSEYDILNATMKENKSVWSSLFKDLNDSNTIMQSFKSSTEELTSAFGVLFMEGKKGWEELGDVLIGLTTSIINSTKQIIDALLAKAIAGIISGEVTSKGIFGLATAAVGVSALKAWWDSKVPELASGGMAYGSSVVEVGEYPGANVNPEVIAPLDKLQSLIRPSDNKGEWETAHVEIPADKLDILLKKKEKRNSLIK